MTNGHNRLLVVDDQEDILDFVAQVAEVSVKERQIRVHRVVCAIDCGLAVNPAAVEAQMQSGIAFGLGAALHSALHFKDGRVQESNFHDYRMLRMNETPAIEFHIIKSTEPPGGVGEPGTVAIAAAVTNAIYAATGKRIRKLPAKPKQFAV